jgi:hypothetical protein
MLNDLVCFGHYSKAPADNAYPGLQLRIWSGAGKT